MGGPHPSNVGMKAEYQGRRAPARSSFSTRADPEQRWAPRGVQRICCFFTMHLLTTWLTADSTKAFEMASPQRWRSP